MDRLDELTRKDLIKGLDKRTKRNSKRLTIPTYKGITDKYTLIFEVNSATGTGSYIVSINLSEYESLNKEKDLSAEDKIRLCIDGDIKINCTCPAMRYWGYEYILSQLGTIEGEEQTRYPTVRNPELDGTLCKHSYIAVRYIGKLWRKIAKDIKDKNFIKY